MNVYTLIGNLKMSKCVVCTRYSEAYKISIDSTCNTSMKWKSF